MVITKFGSQLGQQHYIMAKFSNWVFEFTGGEFRGNMRVGDNSISIWVSNLFFPDDYILFFELKRNIEIYPCELILSISSNKKRKIILTSEELESVMGEFIRDPVVLQSFVRLTDISERKRKLRRESYRTVVPRDNPNN
jgi:hypothetical protein